MFKRIQVYHQRGGINVFFAHTGLGGWVLQHGESSVVFRIIAMPMRSAPIAQAQGTKH
jgi:hypothetical protein